MSEALAAALPPQAYPAGEVWAIVPAKALRESKGRLSHLLSAAEREGLVRDLLRHVLQTIKEAPEVDRTLVISSDPQVWGVAEELGAIVVAETPPPGLNKAVASALDVAAQNGIAGALILPLDLPFVTVADIALMVESALGEPTETGSAVMAIAPDKDGSGTNALFLRPPFAFDFHYGPSSLQSHLHEALARDVAVRMVYAPGLQFDLDTDEDLLAFQAALA